jgi:catechol 2,3-dioxygenase-like lactoylglutathione lyase family enzyme
MSEPTSIQHVNVMVDDLAAARSFYGDLLSLEPIPSPDLGFPAQFYRVNDDQEIHINELPDPPPERAHFCLRLSDFDAVFKRATEFGVIEAETWGKVRRLPTGVMQAFVRDPAGNLIELTCEPDQVVDPAMFDLEFVDSETRFFHRSN